MAYMLDAEKAPIYCDNLTSMESITSSLKDDTSEMEGLLTEGNCKSQRRQHLLWSHLLCCFVSAGLMAIFVLAFSKWTTPLDSKDLLATELRMLIRCSHGSY